MKSIPTIVISIFLSSYACNQKGFDKKYVQLIINEDNLTPTVDIKSYILITDKTDTDIVNAKGIMQVKRKWPQAMQTKDASVFNSILGNNFTFRAEDEFYNRADYIEDRTTSTDTVTSAKYENIVLQFFGDVALLTYRNIVEHHDTIGKTGLLYMSWADMYVKENGKWMIGGSHLIEARNE
jgi:hypothetical protein